MNIVLVHGVLGAHIFAGQPYFNGVAEHFRKQGHDVMESDTKPIATVDLRADQLHGQIVKRFGAAPADKLIIIAHSMGGLDARLMLHKYAELAKHVRSLTCVATPHRGSPVATFLNKPTSPLRRLLDWFSPGNPDSLLRRVIKEFDAVRDLSEEGARKIDAMCPDIDGIRYAEVVGIGRGPNGGDTAAFFKLMPGMSGGVNDGLVPRDSAARPGRKPLEEAHADHADLVGHDVDDFPQLRARKFDHLPLYDRILAAATA